MGDGVAWILVFTAAGSYLSGALIFKNAEGADSTTAWVIGGVVGLVIGAGIFR